MVDVTDLQAVTMLQAEIAAIDQALMILATDNPRITQMLVATADAYEPSAEGLVQTAYMVFPPQMIDGIVAQLNDRRDALNSEIANLGVTGVPASPRKTASRKR